MKNILQPTEARLIIDELLDYDNRQDIGVYIRHREAEFKEDQLLWVKLSDRLARTTHIDEDTKKKNMDSHYYEDDWNKEQLSEPEDRYLFLREYFQKQIRRQLDDRTNLALKINTLPKLAVRCHNYTKSNGLRQKFYGIIYINNVMDVVSHATHYLLFDIQQHYNPVDTSTALDTLLHIYFADTIRNGLDLVGSCIRSYDIVEDDLTNATATKFEIIAPHKLYDVTFFNAKSIYKNAFSRTYYEYRKRLPGKSKEFEAYKIWEISRWEQVQRIYTINDWGYDVISKYLAQIRRYTAKDLVVFKPKQEHSFGLDAAYKTWIIDFFRKVGAAYADECRMPLLHADTTEEDIADLLTTDDYTHAKPIYFLAKSNVIAYLLTNIHNELRDISLNINIYAVIGDCGKVMYRKSMINIENTSDVALSSYKPLTRTSAYEAIKSFDKNVRDKKAYEYDVSFIVKSILNSTKF